MGSLTHKFSTGAMLLEALLLMATLMSGHFTAGVNANPTPGSSLSWNYYDALCPGYGTQGFQATVAAIVNQYVLADPTLPPSMLRMAFHDSFVRGADGSVLINSTTGNLAEKDGPPNSNSLRGFFVIDAVKAEVERFCPGVISCADIVQQVALAAMKANQQFFYPQWLLLYGRRDGRVSLANETIANLPSPRANFTTLLQFFAVKGFDKKDMAVLSGAHTFGQARCIIILNRLYNFTGQGDTDPDLDPDYATYLKTKCPPDSSPTLRAKMDPVTPDTFDNKYFGNVLSKKGFFTSDSQLTKDLGAVLDVEIENEPFNFVFPLIDFPISMKKLSEVGVMLYPDGEIRNNCAVIN